MEKLGSAAGGGGGGVSSPLCSWTPLAGCAGPPCRAASPPSSAGTSRIQPGPEGGDKNGRKRSHDEPECHLLEKPEDFRGQVGKSLMFYRRNSNCWLHWLEC